MKYPLAFQNVIPWPDYLNLLLPLSAPALGMKAAGFTREGLECCPFHTLIQEKVVTRAGAAPVASLVAMVKPSGKIHNKTIGQFTSGKVLKSSGKILVDIKIVEQSMQHPVFS